jgi:iron-sulfur cluster assembly accessory protein
MTPIVKFTAAAALQCRTILADCGAKAITFSLKGGGCNGFEYRVGTTNAPADKRDELVVVEDDVHVHVCGSSVLHLLGATVDWQTDLMGSSFRFDNPNAKSTCGCGTSFNPE